MGGNVRRYANLKMDRLARHYCVVDRVTVWETADAMLDKLCYWEEESQLLSCFLLLLLLLLLI